MSGSGNGKCMAHASAAASSAAVAMSSREMNDSSPVKLFFSDDPSVNHCAGSLVRQDKPDKSNERRSSHDAYANNANFAGQDRVYSIDDEEIDEPPVPIPSTWRQKEQPPQKSWIAAQVKSSAYGFIIGLFVVVPVIMLLTMAKGNNWPSWGAMTEYARKTSEDLGLGPMLSAAGISRTQDGAQEPQNNFPDDVSVAARQSPEGTQNSAVNSQSYQYTYEYPETDTAGQQAAANDTTAAIVEPSLKLAQKAIDDGKMSEARVILAKLASLGNNNAIFALAETFDPNVLAARGDSGQEANAEQARVFYSMALSQGVGKARARLDALQ